MIKGKKNSDDRIHGELEVKDSIHFDPNLKYHTVGGRVVCTAAGLCRMYSYRQIQVAFKYLVDLRRTMLLYDYTFDFMDKHREEMKS
ncbi:MAG: hypothetical protein ACLTXP_14690 [Odoribacter splanchnicus]